VPQTDLFALAEQRLNYIGQRQELLAQNVANADTPHYQSRDLPSFDTVLKSTQVVQAVTNPLHLQPAGASAAALQALPAERAPDGNAVSVENELTKIADGETNAALVGNLWKSYMGMYLNALGHGG
jgi:flagellar basal-body rod protein FlgB